MVSLVGLSILSVFYMLSGKTPSYCVKLNLPSDRRPGNPTRILFSKDYFYQSIKAKKTILVNLNEEYSPDEAYLFKAKMNFVSREIERMQFTHDTATVLQIKLGDANTYSHFVWVLNQALIYRLRRYAFMDDSFFLLANPPVALEGRQPPTM